MHQLFICIAEYSSIVWIYHNCLLSICLLVDILVVSSFVLSQIKLLWRFVYKLLLNHLPLYGCTIVYPFTEGYLGCFQVLALWLNLHYAVFCVGILPESSSSSQGISLKGWAVLAGNDVASDSRYGTTCLFQASGLLLYSDKSIRSAVLHFQLLLTQIYCLLGALQTEFLLQQFFQNHVYLWLHCNLCLCLGHIPYSSVYFLSF